MRREVILLVAGLAVVATLPVQEQEASSSQTLPHSDLLKVILSANPEENDLKTTPDEKPFVALPKLEEQFSQPEAMKQQPPPQPQDPPHTLSQDSPQKEPQAQDTPHGEPQGKPQAQDTPQVEPQAQDTPQEEPQTQDTPQGEPQTQDTPQEQQESQDPGSNQEEPSLPYVSEGEAASSEDSLFQRLASFHGQSVLLSIKREDLPYESEKSEEDKFNSDIEMGTYRTETDGEYAVLPANEDPPTMDEYGTFIYEVRRTPQPSNQEGEPFLSGAEEPQMEPFRYNSDEETLPFEPQMDFLPFDFDEPQMEPLSVLSLEDSLPYESGELVDSNPQEDFFPLEDPVESDYEQPSHEIDEGPFEHADYDYGTTSEEEQLGSEEDIPSVQENSPAEEPYDETLGNKEMGVFSFLFPNFFNEESTDYDDYSYTYDTSNHDDMADDIPFPNRPEMQYESQEVDHPGDREEPSASVDFDGPLDAPDYFLEDEEDTGVVSESDLLHEGDSTEDEENSVSLADFFIPIYEGPAQPSVPQLYPDTGSPEDGSEEAVSFNEEDHSIDDGLYPVEPILKPYQDYVEEDQSDMMFGDNVLFPENLPYEDKGYTSPWDTKGDEEDQTGRLGEDSLITFLDNQPPYIAKEEADKAYPPLRDMMLKGFADKNMDEPWNSAKSLYVDLLSASDAEDDEILPVERDYSSSGLDNDNDAMDIMVVKDPTESFNTFPIRSTVDEFIIQGRPLPPVQDTDGQQASPFWVPQRASDEQFPKIYLSFTDEHSRRTLPVFFDRIDDDTSFSSAPSRSFPRTRVMSDSLTFLNEVLDDDLPPHYLPSPSTSRWSNFPRPDTLSSPRKYRNAFTTPKSSFRDFLRRLSPSFYDDDTYNNMAQRSPSLSYPQTYPHNTVQRYNDLPHQFPHMSPPVPYSSPFNSFLHRDYMYSPVQNYHTRRLETFPFYSANNEQPSLYREDTMPSMYPRQPLRRFDDYTTDLPFTSSARSFNNPRSRFPFFQRPQYSTSSPVYNRMPQYSQNSIYGMEPYQPPPMYPRYTHEYY